MDLRVLSLKIGQTFRSHQAEDAVGGKKVNLVAFAFADGLDAPANGVVLLQKIFQMLLKIPAGFGERDA